MSRVLLKTRKNEIEREIIPLLRGIRTAHPPRTQIAISQDHAVNVTASTPPVKTRGVVHEAFFGIRIDRAAGNAECVHNPPAIVVGEEVPGVT